MQSLSDEGLDPSTHSFVLDQEDGAGMFSNYLIDYNLLREMYEENSFLSDNDTSADLSNDEKADKFDDTTDEIDLAADDEKVKKEDAVLTWKLVWNACVDFCNLFEDGWTGLSGRIKRWEQQQWNWRFRYALLKLYIDTNLGR